MTCDLYTEDQLTYHYYPVHSYSLNFRIKAKHDAHIILSTTQYDSTPCYEVFFGGWKNTKSVIRKNQQKPDVVEVSTPNILSPYEYRAFWIRWDSNTIQAGIQGNPTPIMVFHDPALFHVQYFGVCTGWGATGHWIIDHSTNAPAPIYPSPPMPTYPAPTNYPAPANFSAPLSYPTFPQPAYNPSYSMGCLGVSDSYSRPPTAPRWVSCSRGNVPPNAVVGGRDINGEAIYVARAHHEGALLPGKLVRSHGGAYVPWGGNENSKFEYEVLCDCTPRWVYATNGQIPAGAMISGHTEDGESLYVGRAFHEGSHTTGKVQASHRVCYIPFGGKEVAKNNYEVLLL